MDDKVSMDEKRVFFDVEANISNYARESVWTQRISDKFGKVTAVVLVGLSGIGKTVLASKFANDYDGNVIWLNSKGRETLTKSVYKLCGQELKDVNLKEDKEERSLSDIFVDIYKRFDGRKTLFVFDDARSYSEIECFLPLNLNAKDMFKVLITSTNSEVKDWESSYINIDILELASFNSAESKTLLKASLHISDDSQDANLEKLAERLKNFPLALYQAASGYEKSHTSVENYVESVSSRLQEATCLDFVKIHLQSQLGNLQKEEMGEKAIQMWCIMSYFAWNQIPESFFLENLANNQIPLQIQITSTLQKYSLVTITDGTLRMHELIQEISRQLIISKEVEILEETLRLFSKTISQLENVSIGQKMEYIPHIISVWKYASNYFKLIEEFIIKDIIGKSPHFSFLHLMVRYGKFEFVEKIIENVPAKQRQNIINVKTKESKKSSLHFAVESGNENTVKLLTQYVYRDGINSKNSIKHTPLHLAVKNKFAEIVDILLDFGADHAIQTTHGFTALHYAANCGNAKIFKSLLYRSADINALTGNKFTPLHMAASKGFLDIVLLLLEDQNINANALTKFNETALHLAVRNEHLDVVEVLLSKGIDPNAQNQSGFAAIHEAAAKNNLQLIGMLLRNENVNVDLKTTENNTALDIAASKSCVEIVKAIEMHMKK